MNKIKALRLARGLTQKQLAELVGVTYQHVQCWENGTYIPSGKNLILLAKALNVKPEELIE